MAFPQESLRGHDSCSLLGTRWPHSLGQAGVLRIDGIGQLCRKRSIHILGPDDCWSSVWKPSCTQAPARFLVRSTAHCPLLALADPEFANTKTVIAAENYLATFHRRKPPTPLSLATTPCCPPRCRSSGISFSNRPFSVAPVHPPNM